MTVRVLDDPSRLADAAAAAAGEGFDAIVAAGGDGTVSGVAAGLRASGGEVPLGIVPIGTGNDFAASLGIPSTPRAALDAIRAALAADRVRRIDLLRCVAPRRAGAVDWSCNAVVGGLAGRVGDALTPALRRRWGRFAYLRAGLPELGRLRSHPITLHADGRRFELEALMVVLANTRLAGGGLRLAPSADPSDGRVSLVAFRILPFPALPFLVRRVLLGRHTDHDAVLSLTARHVEIEAGADFWLNRDGETWVSGSCSFTVHPAAVPLLLPAGQR